MIECERFHAEMKELLQKVESSSGSVVIGRGLSDKNRALKLLTRMVESRCDRNTLSFGDGSWSNHMHGGDRIAVAKVGAAKDILVVTRDSWLARWYIPSDQFSETSIVDISAAPAATAATATEPHAK